MTPSTCAVDPEILNFHSDRPRPFLETRNVREDTPKPMWNTKGTITPHCLFTSPQRVWSGGLKLSINLPEVLRLKLMSFNTSYDGLVAVNCFSIHLKHRRRDCVICCAVLFMVAVRHIGHVSLRYKLHWGSDPWHRPSEQNHRHPSMTWGCSRPHGAEGHWPAFSSGQTWRRSCCEGQRSVHSPGLHALLSGPAGETDRLWLQVFAQTLSSWFVKRKLSNDFQKRLPDLHIHQFWQGWTDPCCTGQRHCTQKIRKLHLHPDH